MEVMHVIVIVFGLFAVSRAFLRWRESKITLGEFLFWGAIWAGAMIFALFPDVLALMSNRVGFRRGMDLLIAISIITLFYLLFRVYVKMDETEKEITKLVREISFSKVNKK